MTLFADSSIESDVIYLGKKKEQFIVIIIENQSHDPVETYFSGAIHINL